MRCRVTKRTRAIFRGAVNADRYLLTFVGAGHNAAAPMPAPAESYAFSETLKSFPFTHYADPIWDTRRMNNILAHFVTAHFDARLKGDTARLAYLQVVPNGKDAVYAIDREGRAGATPYGGFSDRGRRQRAETALRRAAPCHATASRQESQAALHGGTTLLARAGDRLPKMLVQVHDGQFHRSPW
jgi:hypothetical protein